MAVGEVAIALPSESVGVPVLSQPVAIPAPAVVRSSRRPDPVVPRTLVVAEARPAVAVGTPVALEQPQQIPAFVLARTVQTATNDWDTLSEVLDSGTSVALPRPLTSGEAAADSGGDGLITGAFKKTGTSIVKGGAKTGVSIVRTGTSIFDVVSGLVRRALPNN